MNRRAVTQIAADVREEFAELRERLSHHLGPDSNVDQARRMLADHVPTMVVAKIQLLLDTLLNYLMEDARAALAEAPTAVKNEFYDLDLRSRVKHSVTLEPASLEFTFDPRMIAGGVAAGVTARAGGLTTALFLCGLVSRIVGGIATLVASAVTFKIVYTATTATARKWLQDDVEKYVADSEQQVSSWLESVEEKFVADFKEFRDGGEQAKEETA